MPVWGGRSGPTGPSWESSLSRSAPIGRPPEPHFKPRPLAAMRKCVGRTWMAFGSCVVNGMPPGPSRGRILCGEGNTEAK